MTLEKEITTLKARMRELHGLRDEALKNKDAGALAVVRRERKSRRRRLHRLLRNAARLAPPAGDKPAAVAAAAEPQPPA